MKKLLFVFVVVLSFAIILVSCSADKVTNSNNGSDLEAPMTDETVSDGQGTDVDEPDANAAGAEGEADKSAENDIESEKEDENEVAEQPPIKLDIKPLEKTDEELLFESASRLGFTNVKLFEAFANAIGVEPANVTQADVDNVHYIAVSAEQNGTNSVLVGYIDYVDLCFSDIDSSELMSKLNEVVMASAFEYDIDKDSLSDLAKFRNVEIFEIYDVKIEDVSFVKEYKNLAMGYFANNGITDVSCLEGYNPESLIEIDFTGNNIEDWTPLYPIKEKVIVMYDMQSGFLLKLDSYLEQTENGSKADAEEKNVEKAEEKAEEKTETSEAKPEIDSGETAVLYDEDGNPVDFGSLFD